MTTQILVGLHRVGVVGLREAIQDAAASGLEDRETITDRILEILASDNYIPPLGMESYRLAIWREFQRHRGEDIRDLYSEVDVVVRGAPGEERERFLEVLLSVFGEYELRPVVAFEPPVEGDRNPQLVVKDDVVVRGLVPEKAFKRAVQRQITDW